MGCTIFKQRHPLTRRDTAKMWMSNGAEYPFTRDDDAFLSEIVTRPDDGPIFMCGSGPAGEVCPCGHLADLLCDFPVGRGKTCDALMCSDCAHHIDDDKDLCMIHFAMFHKASGTTRVFPKKPRLVK